MPKINAIKNVAQTKLKLLLLLRKKLATKWLWANEVIAALAIHKSQSTGQSTCLITKFNFHSY